MAGIKIVDLPALGRDLISTDLLELSLAGGTGSRKITGQEIMNASKLSVGNTPIINGAVGQVLFQGTGNVLQESANLFWDNANGRLGIGTSTPTRTLSVVGSGTSGFDAISFKGQYSKVGYLATDNAGAYLASGAGVTESYIGLTATSLTLQAASALIDFRVGASRGVIFSTGNWFIGSSATDAGFRLDVNGTARVQGNATVQSLLVPTTNLYDIGTLGVRFRDGYFKGILLATEMYAEQFRFAATNYKILNVGGTQIAQWFGTGNLLIQNGGTFTDAGFRLDVNGTARVSATAGTVGTFSGTGTAARVVVNNTTTTPNVGFGFSANSVLKWSLATYGATSDFTFYNEGLASDAIFIKGTTNNVILGSTTDVASALLNVTSTTKGFLPPRMTTTQKNAIATPATGLQIFDTTLNRPCFYDGTTWITL